MIVVLDASAGIEVALSMGEAGLFEALIEKATKVITSDLYKAEVTNVLWKYVKAGLLEKEDVLKRLYYCSELVDEYVDIAENREESLIEGLRMDHSIYDLLYLTLARRNGAILLSKDKKLNKLAKENGIEVYK